MSDWDEMARLINELSIPLPRRGSAVQQQEVARSIVLRFEQRARDMDGDAAPTGVDAVQLRYYPPGDRPALGEASVGRLRQAIGTILKL